MDIKLLNRASVSRLAAAQKGKAGGMMLSSMDMTVKKTNLYELVAEKLEMLIMDETLKVGEKLPSEQALANQFGTSRNIVREALKLLKERGLVNVKVGEGAFICRPHSLAMQNMINRVVLIRDISFDEVYEVRNALEVPAAGCAAKEATEEDIAVLSGIIQQMQQPGVTEDVWAELDWKFHSGVAKASGNKLFSYFIKSLSGSMMEMFVRGYHSAPENMKSGLKAHQEIFKSIQEHDPEGARLAMQKHIYDSQRDVRNAVEETSGM